METLQKTDAKADFLDNLENIINEQILSSMDVVINQVTELVANQSPKYERVILSKLDTSGIDLTAKHKDTQKVIMLSYSNSLPLMLVGSAGTGKSTIAGHVAEFMEVNFYSENINLQTSVSKFDGYTDINGKYIETSFFKCYSNGGVFLLDEVDAGNPNTLLYLNNVITSKNHTFPCGNIAKHEDFRFIATANTYGNGASMEFVGRNKLDKAFLDRFYCVNIDYDNELERQVIKDNNIVNYVIMLRELCAKKGIKEILSIRSMQGIKMAQDCLDLDLNQACKEYFINKPNILELL